MNGNCIFEMFAYYFALHINFESQLYFLNLPKKRRNLSNIEIIGILVIIFSYRNTSIISIISNIFPLLTYYKHKKISCT